MIQLLTQIVFYIDCLFTLTAVLGASLGIGMIYYYILIFKQINTNFTLINNQSK